MNEKMSPRMKFYFSLTVVVIILFSGATVTGALFLLDALQVNDSLSVLTMAAIFLVAIIAGGLMSAFVGRRLLAPMRTLSVASKEVAKGNFAVSVSDSSKLEEVQTTFRNFNAMVRELNSTATLSNDFVANVSHEFKTPLTAIEGYAMLLQEPGLSEQEREEYLDKILFNTRRLSTLVGNILMLSKLENKALAEQYREYRLDEQLRQAVVALEPQWSRKNLSFRAQLPEVRFRGCEGLLQHVWSNLLQNAIRFSYEGQEIVLELLEQTECVVVCIRDHGCGMSPEVQSRIFEKFYQGDASHRSDGNGLGLALVKRIVELSEGIVEVASAPAQGATFRVILPK